MESIKRIWFILLMPQLAIGFVSHTSTAAFGNRGIQKPTFLKSTQESLSNDEISRYSRHLVLGDVGMKGQTALKNASVLVIGAGGLGSPCLMYLAAAGVGHIGIVVSLRDEVKSPISLIRLIDIDCD